MQIDKELLSYEIVNQNGKPFISVKTISGKIKLYSPEEIYAMILANIKETVELKLEKKVTTAVITVPAYFDDIQR